MNKKGAFPKRMKKIVSVKRSFIMLTLAVVLSCVSVMIGHAEELNTLAKVESDGNAGTIAVGAKMFDGKNHVFAQTVPEWLVGKGYFVNSMSGYDVTVKTDGWIYILTPVSGNSSSLVGKLDGFTQITEIDAKVIGTSIGEVIAVMGKQVTAGEQITVGKWGILVADKMEETSSDTVVEDASLVAPALIVTPYEKLQSHPEYQEYVNGSRPWQGIPSMAKDDVSGRLWATWYSGANPEAEKPGEDEFNWVVVFTSADDGENWVGPQLVIDPHVANVRAFDPNLWTDPDGRLWMFWSQSYMHEDERFGTWAIYTDNPQDANPSWSEPVRIANGIAMCDPVVLTKDSGDLKAGAWLLPTAIWRSGREDMQNEKYPNCYVSTDKGATWSYQGSVKQISGTRSCDENMIVQQSDGTLMMWIRTSLGVEKSFSADGGKSWSKAIDADVTNVVSRFWVGDYDKQYKLGVFNYPPDDGTNRTYMTAALSTDDGETWPYKLVIDTRTTTYPDAYVDEDGFIYIIYDHGRGVHGQIVMAKITAEDIIAGTIVNENSKLKVLVDDNMVPNLSLDTGVFPENTIFITSLNMTQTDATVSEDETKVDLTFRMNASGDFGVYVPKVSGKYYVYGLRNHHDTGDSARTSEIRIVTSEIQNNAIEEVSSSSVFSGSEGSDASANGHSFFWCSDANNSVYSLTAGVPFLITRSKASSYDRLAGIALVPAKADGSDPMLNITNVSWSYTYVPNQRSLELWEDVTAGQISGKSVTVTVNGEKTIVPAGAARIYGFDYVSGKPSLSKVDLKGHAIFDATVFDALAMAASPVSGNEDGYMPYDVATDGITQGGLTNKYAVVVNGKTCLDIDQTKIKNGDIIETKAFSADNFVPQMAGFASGNKFVTAISDVGANGIQYALSESTLTDLKLYTDNYEVLNGCMFVGYLCPRNNTRWKNIAPNLDFNNSKIYFDGVRLKYRGSKSYYYAYPEDLGKVTFTDSTEEILVENGTIHHPYKLTDATGSMIYDYLGENLWFANNKTTNDVAVDMDKASGRYVLSTDGSKLLTLFVVTYAEDGSIIKNEIKKDVYIDWQTPYVGKIEERQTVYVWGAIALEGTTMVPLTKPVSLSDK